MQLEAPLTFKDGTSQGSAGAVIPQGTVHPASPTVGQLFVNTGSPSATILANAVPYVLANAYAAGSLVTFNGGTYYAPANIAANMPPPGNGWQTIAAPGISLAGAISRVLFFGHSLMAAGGAASPDRGWGSVFAAMARAQDINYGVGGAALAYDNESAAGDGGWQTILKNLQFPPHGTNWRGAWNSSATYYLRDGVLSGGNWYVWGANNPCTNFPAPGGGWLQVTGPTSPGASPYPPRPDVPCLFYGNNDLGYYKQWTVFQEALLYALTIATASQLWDDNHPNIVYTQGGSVAWPARSTGTGNYGTGYQGMGGGAGSVGNYFTINLPPDFPGGTVSLFGFLSVSAAGSFTTTVDGVAGPSKTFTDYRSGGITFNNAVVVSTDPQRNTPWVHRFEGLSAGPHTIVVTSTANMGLVFFDGVAIEAYPVRQPVILPSLIKPISYSLWSISVTDADVDTWNNNIINNVLPHFPAVIWVPFDTSVLPKDQTFFYMDSVHLNDRGQGLLAKKAFDTVSAAIQNWTAEQITLVNGPDRVGTSQQWFNKATANFIIPASPDNTYLAISDATTGGLGSGAYSGYNDVTIKALAGDWIDLSLDVKFNNEASFPYVDLVTVDTRSNAWINYVSTRSASPGSGFSITTGNSATVPEARYADYAARWLYQVQDADVIYGIVTFRLIAKKYDGGTATVVKTILRQASTGWQVFIMAKNNGPHPQMLSGWAA